MVSFQQFTIDKLSLYKRDCDEEITMLYEYVSKIYYYFFAIDYYIIDENYFVIFFLTSY